jgi:hypothetical protein
MKRDFDLIRLILIDLEGDESIDLSTFSNEEIIYHKALIKEAGFADGMVHYNSSTARSYPDAAVLTRLTWEGHEFLDKARSEKVWSKAKTLVKQNAGTLSLEALKIGLSEVIKGLMS